MRHIISILLQNEAGALSRAAGMFSARGYNIESLSVAPTDDETVSRLTLVTSGSDDVIRQINKQTEKLIDVVDIADLTEGDHYEREMLLIKIEDNSDELRAIVEEHRARIIEDAAVVIIELTGTGQQIDDFINEVEAVAEILEVVRSGVAGIASGRNILNLNV